MAKTKQKSSAAKNVAIFFVVFIILEAAILFGVSRVFKNKDVTPSFAGFSMYIMDADSMGDSVPKGALVIAANGSPSSNNIKNAVLAENVPGIGTSVFWLAGVSSKGEGVDGVVYTLCQEKNINKTYEVDSKNVVGVASSYYLTAGKVLGFITTKFGMAVCVIIPLFLLVLIELIIAIATHSGTDDDEDEDEDDEDEEEVTVTLDDVLFGPENEKALHKKRAEEHEKEMQTMTETDDTAKQDVLDEQEQKEEPAKQADIHPSYYEKAAEIVDGVKSEEAPAAVKTENTPEQLADVKPAAVSLEDLMKLMEEEQQKLRDQLKQ